MSIEKIFLEIREERFRQDEQWGGTAHDDLRTIGDWLEYIDLQLSKCCIWDNQRQAFVKIAALAVAAIESLDRKSAELSRSKQIARE